MPKERLIVFQRGHKVGELAQSLFPGGINMSPGHPGAYRKAIINTSQKIQEGFPVIYEAAFQHDQVLIFLDILVHTGTGWHAYEVKSSGGISDTYRLDAALQYHVIRGAGIDLQGISIIHIDKEYVLEDELDPKKLFKIVNVTADAVSRQEFVRQQIIREKEALELAHSPKIDVGDHCREPYDCDFIGHCWKNVPKKPEQEARQQLDIENIKKITTAISSQTAFLKLNVMLPAVPMYKGTHPYQSIAFGYSIRNKDDGQVKSLIFGHESNPEEKLIPALTSDIKGIDNIICFGQSYLIKKMFPEIKVLDLKDMILNDSDFFNEMKDRSELEKLRIMFKIQQKEARPAYLSDAVAEHYFLKDLNDDEVRSNLEIYSQIWVKSIHELFIQFLNIK